MGTPLLDLLSKVPMHWNIGRGLYADNVYVLCEWLPFIDAGMRFSVECYEDQLYWGHIFVNGIPHSDGDGVFTWTPNVHHGTCIMTGKEGACRRLRININELTYIPQNGFKKPTRANIYDRVSVLGHEGEIVAMRGFIGEDEPNWKTEYTIKFDDGTKFTAYRGQFTVIKE